MKALDLISKNLCNWDGFYPGLTVLYEGYDDSKKPTVFIIVGVHRFKVMPDKTIRLCVYTGKIHDVKFPSDSSDDRNSINLKFIKCSPDILDDILYENVCNDVEIFLADGLN